MKRTADPRTRLLASAAAAGVPPDRFSPVRHPRWQGLVADILDRFTVAGSRDGRAWLWADLCPEPVVGVTLPDSRASLAVLPQLLPPGERVWFLAEDAAPRKQGAPFWVFDADTEAIPRVLAGHHLFEYYVVDRHLEWIVGENHHSWLFAIGEPVLSRLAKVKAQLG